jgi:chromosome transmission fidelity protein 1
MLKREGNINWYLINSNKINSLIQQNPKAGNIFYENSCMKAVNQCIGRAVRHVGDYSTVVLLDKRYSNKIQALPNWIQRTVSVHTKFSTAIQALARFFTAKKQI